MLKGFFIFSNLYDWSKRKLSQKFLNIHTLKDGPNLHQKTQTAILKSSTIGLHFEYFKLNIKCSLNFNIKIYSENLDSMTIKVKNLFFEGVQPINRIKTYSEISNCRDEDEKTDGSYDGFNTPKLKSNEKIKFFSSF